MDQINANNLLNSSTQNKNKLYKQILQKEQTCEWTLSQPTIHHMMKTQIAGNATQPLQFVCLGEIQKIYLNM